MAVLTWFLKMATRRGPVRAMVTSSRTEKPFQLPRCNSKYVSKAINHVRLWPERSGCAQDALITPALSGLARKLTNSLPLFVASNAQVTIFYSARTACVVVGLCRNFVLIPYLRVCNLIACASRAPSNAAWGVSLLTSCLRVSRL
jgi:hypothetical protein